MQSNSETSPAARYALKAAAVAVFLTALFALGKILSLVPFLDEFSVSGLSISDLTGVLMSLVAVAVLTDYAKNTSQDIAEMLPSLPSPDRFYRLAIHFMLAVFSYYAFYPLAEAFLKEAELIIYKLFFAAMVLWLAACAGTYFYFNREKIGAALLGLAGKFKV